MKTSPTPTLVAHRCFLLAPLALGQQKCGPPMEQRTFHTLFKGKNIQAAHLQECCKGQRPVTMGSVTLVRKVTCSFSNLSLAWFCHSLSKYCPCPCVPGPRAHTARKAVHHLASFPAPWGHISSCFVPKGQQYPSGKRTGSLGF